MSNSKFHRYCSCMICKKQTTVQSLAQHYNTHLKIKNCPQCNIEHTKVGPYCSHKCATLCNSKSKNWTNIKTGPAKGYGSYTKIRFLTCEICSNIFLWNSINKGSIHHCTSNICKKAFRHNTLVGKVGGYRPNSLRRTRAFYNGMQMDSGTELKFAKLLDAHNIKWTKNSTIYFEYLPGKKYYPDFFLEEFNQWIEIKSHFYYRLDDPLRWNSVSNLEVIWDHDLKLPAVCQGTNSIPTPH